MDRCIVATRGGQLFETDGKKWSQQIRSEKMVDHISSYIIGAIAISIPPEDNATISRDNQFVFLLQQLEEDEVHNMEEKEHMITRDGELATMMQQQEEE